MSQTLGALSDGKRNIKVFIAFVTFALLFTLLSGTAGAQTQSAIAPRPDLAYRSDQEIRISATIQQVVSRRVEYSPAGLHLMLAGPQGAYDASLGPYLSPDVKRSLAAGKSIEVTGAIETVRGQSYLLVRELTVNGKLITVRNERGFLLNARSGPRVYDSLAKGAAR
jgi:hypothetical protein